MERTPASVGDVIRVLARQTEAPESFVNDVKALFTGKGISLDQAAAPFAEAIADAFLREEQVRRQAEAALASLADLEQLNRQFSEQTRKELNRVVVLRDTLQFAAEQFQRNLDRFQELKAPPRPIRATPDDLPGPLLPGPSGLM